MSRPWEPVEGAAAGLVARTETKPDGRRLTRYRLAGADDPADAGAGADPQP